MNGEIWFEIDAGGRFALDDYGRRFLAGLRRSALTWGPLGVIAFDSWALALAGPSVLAVLTVPEADPFGLQLRLADGEFGGYWGDDCSIWDDYAPDAPGYIYVQDLEASPEEMAGRAADWIATQLSRPLLLEEHRSSAFGLRHRTWVFDDTGERSPCCRSCRKPHFPGGSPRRGQTLVAQVRDVAPSAAW
ncbi:hypothetical protein [Catenulispora pinisilvae]|uniref:hypothetical protein n=1 Tax=Catenulispora pinisilvae TaxID=2705253 RepID=UPI0018926557|nr:hypothetical protein [Catenulispora pinisilvae]